MSTVNIVQNYCLFQSLNDYIYIEVRLLRENILSVIISLNLQVNLLQNLMSVEHVILSIYTFLKNIKYLKSCARILKIILLTKCKDSLTQAFYMLYNRQIRFKEQMSAFLY